MLIRNIVATGSLGTALDLTELSNRFSWFDYDKDHYHGAYIVLPSCKVTIYSSGKYIMSGLKSIQDLESSFNQLVSMFHPINSISVSFPIISNIVSEIILDHKLNLVDIYINIINYSDILVSYEPESFPGLIIKTSLGTANVFSSGKIILLGSKSLEAAEQLEFLIISILSNDGTHQIL